MKLDKKKFCKKVNEFSIATLFIFFALFTFVSPAAFAQSHAIKGTVSAAGTPVQNVSVNFIDNNDTTKQFSVITDTLGNFQLNVVTDVKADNKNIPSKFTLGQNYPNPFSSTTSIPYQLEKATDVHVTIYDVLGREIRKFNSNLQGTGSHNVLWDGRNNFGARAAAGIYFYRVEAGGESQVKKMVFGTGAGSGLVSLQNLSFSEVPRTIQGTSVQETFRIQITNTGNTIPPITPEVVDNIVIQNDTTIDITADMLSVAPTVVYSDSLQQYIRGFGATNLFFFGRPDMTDSEIQTAFGTGDGQVGFTILRLGIDVDSTHWSQYVATAKKAYNMGVTIIASPWYAPSSMVESVNGVSRVRHDMYSQYAAHLNSFVEFMKNNGVPIYGMSMQNEPDITNNWTSWTANEIFNFMHNNADAIVGTKVMDPESFHFDRSYSDPILNDSVACANTDIICGHIYGGGSTLYPLALQKGKEVWMTEYLINTQGNGANMDTSWNAAMLTAKTFNDCMNANMSAYVWWYIVRYYGPIDDGTYLKKGSVTRKGYVMSQFARFIRPGYHRIKSASSPQKNVTLSAYVDSTSSKAVIVVINSGASSVYQTLTVNGVTASGLTPYTSTSTKSCLLGSNVALIKGTVTVKLEPLSVTTFISN